MNTIQIVDVRTTSGELEVTQITETGRNFLAILKPGETELARLCHLIGCSSLDQPERLGRWGIHALNDVLEPADYEKLLKTQKAGDAIYFIEQLNLKHNHPPRIKQYMVYCEVRGIISHHDSLEEAKSSFFHYLESFRRARLFLMVGIYQWQAAQWNRLRTVF